NVSSAGGHVKNSFAPARIECRMRSGSALSATAKMASAGDDPRRRSIVDIADVASPRTSTTTRSGAAARPSRDMRSSIRLMGTAPERSIRPIWLLKPSSSLKIDAASWAMLLNQANVDGEQAARRGKGRVDDSGHVRDVAVDLVPLNVVGEEAEEVRHA